MSISSPSKTAAIPPKVFYSHVQVLQKVNKTHNENARSSSLSPTSYKTYRRSTKYSINKGVHHKVRRQKNQMKSLDVNSILESIGNEQLRSRIQTNREEKQQIEKIHNIFRNSQNPIELARPLRALNMSGNSDFNQVDVNTNDSLNKRCDTKDEFSDLDSSSDEISIPKVKENEEKLILSTQLDNNMNTIIHHVNPSENRKFFKSGKTTSIPKEIKITENIKALVCNGKISLVSEKRKFRKQSNLDFSDAQAAVNVIIKKFDYMDPLNNKNEREVASEEVRVLSQSKIVSPTAEHNNLSDFGTFRRRISDGTDDKNRINAQTTILDFLIANKICNEDTFNVFITEAESHRNEAIDILKQYVNNKNLLDSVPTNTDNAIAIGCQNDLLKVIQSYNYLTKDLKTVEMSIDDIITCEFNFTAGDSHDIKNITFNNKKHVLEKDCKKADDQTQSSGLLSDEIEKFRLSDDNCNASPNPSTHSLYPVFYVGKYKELDKISIRQSRTWNGGFGPNQYQIDAGQKEFGAKQCKHCGLIYAAHEPEEEKLHREYHSSLHILRFKGWIDEDKVASFPEWGRDGRIIRITDAAHQKRRERLKEILTIVDKELGFSSYIIPNTFVAYFAVRNCQIVGFCLVQPLQKANKYVCNNGVDCSTVEEFEAKCGISRIWVSPLHRRMNIGKKLVQAARVNTITGEQIPIHKIAFSAPTTDGKLFAQRIVGSQNFLIYQ